MTSKRIRELNLFLIAFFAVSLFAYLFMNGGAYWRELRYSLFLRSPFANADIREGNIIDVRSGGAPFSTSSPITSGGFQLAIPRIEITAPIAVPKDETKQGILASLEEGVGLYPGSVDPGTPGRVILLGHSSKASWYRGEYAYVFALLPKLEVFDKIYVTGGGKKYIYQVFAKQILTPQATNEFFATTPPDSELNLVTCYPIGSASKRTIIQAKLISEEKI